MKDTVGCHKTEKLGRKNKGNKASVQYKWYVWALGTETANYVVVPAISTNTSLIFPSASQPMGSSWRKSCADKFPEPLVPWDELCPAPWAAPCAWDGAFWSAAAAPWGLGICQSCHLWRGLLAVLPKVLWLCKTAGIENKPWGFILWWKSRVPKGTELVGSVELGWGLQLGERLERGMLSLEVPLWSLLAFVGSQQLKGKRHFWLWASGPKPGCHLSWPQLLLKVLVLTGADKQEWISDSPAQ